MSGTVDAVAVTGDVETAPTDQRPGSPGNRRAALRRPHVARVLVTSLLARLPTAMATLVLLLLVGPVHGYALAGLGCTLLVGASALTSPVLARLVDRRGVPSVVGPAAAINAVGFVLLAVLPRSLLGGEYAAAVLAGLATPPISAVARGLWPRMVPEPLLPVLYGLEATLQELVYISGPALVAIVADAAGPRSAAAMTAGVGFLGSLAFITTPVFVRRVAKVAGARLRLLQVPALVAWLLLAASLTASFTMTEVAVVAFVAPGRTSGSLASGMVLAVWSAGSMVGGILVGGRRRSTTDRAVLLGGLGIGAAIAVTAAAPDRLVLAVLLFAAGLLIAPGLAQLYQRIAAVAPAGSQTEAFGWLATAFIVGAAAGASLGGACVSGLGARAGLGLAAVPPLVGCFAAAVIHRRLGVRAEEPPPVVSAL